MAAGHSPAVFISVLMPSEMSNKLGGVDRACPGDERHVAAARLDLQNLYLATARAAAADAGDRRLFQLNRTPGDRVGGWVLHQTDNYLTSSVDEAASGAAAILNEVDLVQFEAARQLCWDLRPKMEPALEHCGNDFPRSVGFEKAAQARQTGGLYFERYLKGPTVQSLSARTTSPSPVDEHTDRNDGRE